MPTKTSHHRRKKISLLSSFLSLPVLQRIAFSTMVVAGAFALGIGTAGNVHPFSALQAQEQATLPGDIDGNGVVNDRDVIKILEFSQNLATPTAEERKKADVDSDLSVTVKDALRVLHTLILR